VADGNNDTNIKTAISNAVANKPRLIDELFKDDENITVDDTVLAIKTQNIHLHSLATKLSVINKKSEGQNTHTKEMSNRLQKMFDEMQELKQNSQTMAEQRAFSGSNVDEDEIVRKVLEKTADPDEILIKHLKKENKKYTAKVRNRAIFFITVIGMIEIANLIGFKNIMEMLKNKDFNNSPDVNQTVLKKKPIKTAPTLYVIPKDAPFSCKGVNGTYNMPEDRELTGDVKDGYLIYQIDNGGKKYICKTNRFSKK
jgi:flagellar hook-basal body complex protein FliE